MKKLPLVCILVLGCGSAGWGCATDDLSVQQVEPVEDTVSDLDGFISDLGHLEVADSVPKSEIECGDACPPDSQEGDSFCTYQRFTETSRFDRFVALQPNSATLWPGTVVRGADAAAGLLTPLGATLAPVTFSVSLENIAGSPVGVMDEPSLSAFRAERNRILASDLTGTTPAALDFDIEEIHSTSQLSLAIGASVSWPGGGDIAASFDFDSSERKTKLLVNFTQAYYTIDVDTPAHPADFFADDVTVGDLAAEVGSGNPPVYVQSITYGRRVLFTVETSSSKQEIEAALSAAYASAVDVEVDVSVSQRETLEQSRISAFVLGGSGADATGLIDGFDGLVDYIRRGGDYSKESPGAPIGYKLAYLDNAVTELAFTTDYAERSCAKNRATLRFDLTKLEHLGGGDLGGNIELYGYVAVRLPIAENEVLSCDEGGEPLAIWFLDTGQFVSFPKFGSWTPDNPASISVEDVAFGEGQHLCLFTHILENDQESGELSANDDFGKDALLISFDQGWLGEHVLQARGDGENAVDAHVTISLQE